MRTERTGGDEV